MIKYILRLSIAAFIIIFTFDTINFYLENSKIPRENQLVVVQPKLEVVEPKVAEEVPFLVDYKEKVVLYGGLGAAAATGLGVLCYCLSVCSKAKLRRPDSPSPVKEDGDAGLREPDSGAASGTKLGHSLRGDSHPSHTSGQVEEGETLPKALPADEKVMHRNSVPRNISANSQEGQEDGNITVQTSLLAENGSQKSLMKNVSRHSDLYDHSDLLVGSRIILDSEISYKSRNSYHNDIPLLTIPEQVLATISCLQNKTDTEVDPPLPYITKDDLTKIEIRLENIENKITQMEHSSQEHNDRVEVAETELVELHEQIYTILTKLEEEQKPNYIILSPSSMLEEAKENAINNVIPTKPNSREIEHHQTQESNEPEKKLTGDEMRNQYYDKILPEIKKSDSLIDQKEASQTLSEIWPQPQSRLKSIGLEAILMKEMPVKSSTAPPRKANPKVPTHYVQPYKRSAFTETDSKSDIRKVSHRLMRARNERLR